MILFCLFWNVLFIGESSNYFSTNGSQNIRNSVSTNPIPVLSNDASASSHHPPRVRRKRNRPGNPDPNSEVISLSPETLLATHRFTCEICTEGFQRDQNLTVHRRTHNIFQVLKQKRPGEIRKRVYVCPEPTCTHHNPSRALGDLTGIKKHFSRKHGQKNLPCEKCPKVFAVQSDLKAHYKTCCTREYKCECGILFSRKKDFNSHRGFCNALTQENARISANTVTHHSPPPAQHQAQSQPFHPINQTLHPFFPSPPHHHHNFTWDPPTRNPFWGPPATNPSPSFMSITEILEQAGCGGSRPLDYLGPSNFMRLFDQEEPLTSNFMGLNRGNYARGGGGNMRNGAMSGANVGLREVLNFTDLATYESEINVNGGEGEAEFVFGADPTWK